MSEGAMTETVTTDLPGFADPVHGPQTVFRAVLDAMAHPGSIVSAEAGLTAPAPLAPATAALLLTLADAETPLWLDPDAAAARGWITFHCGAPVAGPADAAFGVALSLPDLTRFAAGDDDAPEQSTTLIVQVAALGAGPAYRLEGPGLREPATLRVTGLPEDFAARWAANARLYPRGVDLVLCTADRLVALPRTVRVA
jgi:alpha-D-ribose 1-methylphosphonate 5-triphosphate synthase subunit PhnH